LFFDFFCFNKFDIKLIIIIFFKRESRIDKEYSLLPQSLLELGLIEMNLQNRDKAKAILDKVIKNYTKYTTENLVHIRVYAAFREMGFNTDKDNDNLYQSMSNDSLSIDFFSKNNCLFSVEEEVESDFNHNEEKFMNIE
jgi:tetratricopeptide (TPR) repeat protein